MEIKDDDIVEYEQTEKDTFIFDGCEVKIVATNGEVSKGTWSATKEKVTFCSVGDTTVFDVIESSKKKQVWESKEIEDSWEYFIK